MIVQQVPLTIYKPVPLEHQFKTLHQLFREQAKRTPNNLAVIDELFNVKLTYSELDKKSDQLATYLASRYGVSRGETPSQSSIVALYLEKSADFDISFWAAMKAGGGYLPLDISLPSPVLEKIFLDCKPAVVISSNRLIPNLSFSSPLCSPQILILEDLNLEREVGDNISDLVLQPGHVDDLAYIVYSSGTTGTPKGILSAHGPASLSYLWRLSYCPADIATTACGIFYVWELPLPHLRGSANVCIPSTILYDPLKLGEFMRRNKVEEILFTPSLLESCLNVLQQDREGLGGNDEKGLSYYWKDLKVVWICGEVVTVALRMRILKELADSIRIYNLFGISECHNMIAIEWDRKDLSLSDNALSVGWPMYEAEVSIRDENLKPLSINQQGELCVAGPTLAIEYLNLPEKTKAAFPFVEEVDETGQKNLKRIYRTGDLATIRNDGQIEIYGRIGQMIKLRGYSINLHSVAQLLHQHIPYLQTCVVQPSSTILGTSLLESYLIGYLVPAPEVSIEVVLSDWGIDDKTGISGKLHKRLKAFVPLYQIPAVWIVMDDRAGGRGVLPMDKSTGKLDVKSLPKPPQRSKTQLDEHIISTKFTTQLLSLRNTVETTCITKSQFSHWEKKISKIISLLWENILNIPNGTTNDLDSDFFALGGHSLKISEFFSLVRRIFGIEVSAQLLFQYPTIRLISSVLLALIFEKNGLTYQMEEKKEKVDWEGIIAGELTQIPSEPVIPSPQSLSLQSSSHILITGSTGFFGAFISSEILNHFDSREKDAVSKLWCLVRASNTSQGYQRVVSNLSKYGLWKDHYKQYVEVVIGDLEKPRFGFEALLWESLSTTIQIVFHVGANVNYALDYKTIAPSIVGGTKSMILFCSSPPSLPSKTLHYISTNAVFPGSFSRCTEDPLSTSSSPHPCETMPDGYSQSKFISELLLYKAFSNGLKCVIHRPGWIGPSSIDGTSNPTDLLAWIIGACATVSTAPLPKTLRNDDIGDSDEDINRWRIDSFPIDILSKFVVGLAKYPDLYSSTNITITNNVYNKPLFAPTVFQWLSQPSEQNPYAISKFTSIKEWLSTVKTTAEDRKNKHLADFEGLFRDYSHWLLDGKTYDDTHFRRLLELVQEREAPMLPSSSFRGGYPVLDKLFFYKQVKWLRESTVVPAFSK